MYNRYIPQPDGSFRRSRMEDPNRSPPPITPQPAPPPCVNQPEPKPVPQQPQSRRPRPTPCRSNPPPKQEGSSVGGFLRKLLPKDFDTGDLIVVMLLLLMAGDCPDEQNTALLTLVLYFFM